MLSFGLGAIALTAGFTNGAGQIWLDEVNCAGTETRLIDCPANPLGTHDCSHFEDAGVRCAGKYNQNMYTYICMLYMQLQFVLKEASDCKEALP